jgi:hypothetical protein
MPWDGYMEPLDAALIASLQQALRTETHPERALRTALLGLIYLVQDEASPALRGYLEWLLTNFPPLSDTFADGRQPFFEGHFITRRWVVDHTELLLHEDWLWDLVDRFNGNPRAN